MLLPIYDRNPLKVIPFQVVTVTIIGLCVLVFACQLLIGDEQLGSGAVALGLIPVVLFETQTLPADIALVPPKLTLVTSMFLHGDWLHLGGNMLFLWVFGDNIEDSMGHRRFALFYLLCGVAAGLTHAMVEASSTSPMIGASGAASGVLGAYLMLHPRVKILVLTIRFFPLYISAYIAIGLWLVLQIFSVVVGAGGNVAWWAHLGGFAAGVLLIPLFKRGEIPLFDRGVAH